MVEPVVLLLNGRGHRIIRARTAGIDAEDDQTLVEYAVAQSLVVVTFDRHLRDKTRRGGCRCLHVRPPERSARERLAGAYDEVIRLFTEDTCELVTLAADGSATC
jgi:hypothetical protein